MGTRLFKSVKRGLKGVENVYTQHTQLLAETLDLLLKVWDHVHRRKRNTRSVCAQWAVRATCRAQIVASVAARADACSALARNGIAGATGQRGIRAPRRKSQLRLETPQG